ncbi:hypothetical protein [Priestia megaterium]|uniref:hypothetical protein n=1 Tax=Priestia megaterium TaxID=1404 RepID=UPI001596D667|nr:hypothetical protein [Priestia megaterium]
MYDLNASSDAYEVNYSIKDSLFALLTKSLHKNLQSNGGKYGLWIRAYERSPVTNLTIRHSNFHHVATPLLMENVKDPVFEELCINGSCMNTNR